jgi:hypothetical protein
MQYSMHPPPLLQTLGLNRKRGERERGASRLMNLAPPLLYGSLPRELGRREREREKFY